MEKIDFNRSISTVLLADKINEIIDWINNENLSKIADLKALMQQTLISENIKKVFDKYEEEFKNGK